MINIYRITVKSKNDKLEYSIIKLHRNGEKYEQGKMDVLLVNRGLAESREKAKAIIMSGNVYVEGQKEDKAGSTFADTANIEVRGTTLKYVSVVD